MPTFWGASNGSGQLYIDVGWSQNIAGNYSDVTVNLYYSGQWASSSNSRRAIAINGSQTWEFTGDLTMGTGTSYLGSSTARVGHNADGTKSSSAAGSLTMPFIGWYLEVGGNYSLPTIQRAPSAPTRPNADQFTATGMRVLFASQGSVVSTTHQLQRATNAAFTENVNTQTSGGMVVTGLTSGTTYYFRARSGNAQGWSPWGPVLTTYTLPRTKAPVVDSINVTGLRVLTSAEGGTAGSTTWGLQYSTSADFSTGVTSVSTTGTTILTNLQPGTTYYFRSRGSNSSGTGPWSATTTASTATTDPPGLSVSSTTTGAAATYTLTPPPAGTVTNYNIEAEYLTPLPKPTGADKSYTVTSLTGTLSGLVPGATYRWRARANISGYLTEWSAWSSVTQINPNSLDAIYFDSATPASGDLQYASVTVGGLTFSQETVPAPKYFDLTEYGASRYLPVTGNLVPSIDSTKMLRVKLTYGNTAPDTVAQEVALMGGPYVGAVGFTGIAALPSATYMARATVRATVAMKVRLKLASVYFVPGGAFQQRFGYGEVIDLIPGQPVELWVTVKSADQTSYVYAALEAMGSYPDDTLIDLDGVYIGFSRVARAFSGDTPDAGEYFYEWDGVPMDSDSSRYLLPGGAPDPFLDPNCPPPPSAPRPPAPVNECIPEVELWRRYLAPIPANTISSSFTSLPTFSITTRDQSEGPIRVRVFENPDNASAGDFVPGQPISEQVVTFIPANAEAVLDAVSERAYGRGAGAESYQDIGHMVFGADGGPATWPELECGANYMLALDVPSSSPLGNADLQVSLTTRMG